MAEIMVNDAGKELKEIVTDMNKWKKEADKALLAVNNGKELNEIKVMAEDMKRNTSETLKVIQGNRENELRQKKRNNFIISSKDPFNCKETEMVKSVINDRLKLHLNFSDKQVKKINEKLILVMCDSESEKKEIFEIKKLLKDSDIYLNHDLTFMQRSEERALRQQRKEAREQNPGSKVYIKNGTVIVERKQ